MRYAMLLKPHANVRYRLSLQKLALIELECLLNAWGVANAHPGVAFVSGEPFLTFEADALPPDAWNALSRHSGVCLAARLDSQDALRPLPRGAVRYEDLPQVLKYKGKTNADFTRMLLHCAQCASDFARQPGPLRVLDPVCGKATTLFCAFSEGHDALGVDVDARALHEADAYFARYLRLNHLKHKRTASSLTLRGGGNAAETAFSVALEDSPALSVRLVHGDARRIGDMLRPGSCHIAVADLPYGVQHAPKGVSGLMTPLRLLQEALPGCVQALAPGGAMAVSFNLHTLRREDAVDAMRQAGLKVLSAPPYDDFSHWVEQAVDRDAVVGRKDSIKPPVRKQT